jgi:uncharacterized protein YoxC
MNEVVLITISIVTAITLIVLGWLFIEYRKLKQRFDALSRYVEQNNKDIAGLCSAAVSVDNSLLDSRDQLKNIVEKITDFEQHEQQTAQPYHNAIQRVRQGADINELTQEYGLSQDEAVLLIRLHGQVENRE